MIGRITKQPSSSKARWLAALLCAVAVSIAAFGSGSAPPATAGPDVSGGGLTDAGNQLWHQDSTGILDAAEELDSFGQALASGDFNGDGVEDLAVGVLSEDVGGAENAGAVNVIYGSGGGLTEIDNQFWHQDSPGILGTPEETDLFGHALASGDFNGDGFDDLAVGVSNESIGDTAGAGAVSVIYGSDDGLTEAGNQLWHQDSTGIVGAVEPVDRFGRALTSADFNGDGFDDLAVGVFGEDIGSISAAGAVNVIYGSDGGLTQAGNQLWSQASTGILGAAEEGDRFGEALTSGDFDGDGFADLAVGVSLEDIDGNSAAGAVNVIYGSDGGLTAAGSQFWHQNSPGIADTIEEGDLFGWELASGNFNGDEFADLAVGAPREDIDGVEDAGAVNVIYGSSAGLTDVGNQLWSQASTGILGAAEPVDLFGWRVASGDFDGDGFADLAVNVVGEDIDGAENAGAVNVIYGSGGGLTEAGDQIWHQDSPGILDAAEEGDQFGSALTSGDFDGGGVADLAVGVSGEDIGGATNAGAVNVLYGSAPAPTATPTPTATSTAPAPVSPTNTPPPDKELGDVNSDGQVNAIDAALILQFSAGLIGSVPNPASADVNSDGEMNAVDAALILQFSAGLIGSLPP
ncbi:MAG: FG-GAP repeat protein [Chloroflexi bacterium]|nr:FG-GAP repeat protein [Chloroflexota bacterium]